MPASGPVTDPKLFPAAVMEDQEALAAGATEPIVMGAPPFSSNDPETDGRRLVPLGGESVPESSDEDKKAAEWKADVEAADSQEALDAVAASYGASGADFKSVIAAIEKKQTELNEAAKAAEDNS